MLGHGLVAPYIERTAPLSTLRDANTIALTDYPPDEFFHTYTLRISKEKVIDGGGARSTGKWEPRDIG